MFRTSEFANKIYEVEYKLENEPKIPNNNRRQDKVGYRFIINNKDTLYDWYNAYFTVSFKLQKLADGTAFSSNDRITVINSSHSLSIV